jgi:hypothetical protein
MKGGDLQYVGTCDCVLSATDTLEPNYVWMYGCW